MQRESCCNWGFTDIACGRAWRTRTEIPVKDKLKLFSGPDEFDLYYFGVAALLPVTRV